MRRISATCLVLLGLALGGCGGSSGGGGKSVTFKPGAPLPITAREYSFNPGSVTVDTGGKGATVAMQLNNGGSTPHDLRVEKDGQEVGGTPIVEGGKIAKASVKLQPGDYTFFCSVGDHEQLGMKGSLTVK
jgi:plastocyanin